MLNRSSLIFGAFVCLAVLLAFAPMQSVEAQRCPNVTTCHACIDETITAKCGFCRKPRDGRTFCQNTTDVGKCNNCDEDECYARQCSVNNKFIVWVIVPCSIAGVLLIGGIWCWCCCRSRRAERLKAYEFKESKKEAKLKKDREEKQTARRDERKAKTDLIRQKYGIFENDPEQGAEH